MALKIKSELWVRMQILAVFCPVCFVFMAISVSIFATLGVYVALVLLSVLFLWGPSLVLRSTLRLFRHQRDRELEFMFKKSYQKYFFIEKNPLLEIIVLKNTKPIKPMIFGANPLKGHLLVSSGYLLETHEKTLLKEVKEACGSDWALHSKKTMLVIFSNYLSENTRNLMKNQNPSVKGLLILMVAIPMVFWAKIFMNSNFLEVENGWQ